MKKHLKFVANKIWTMRGLLTVFCMIAVLYGVSFVSHADEKGRITASNVNVRETASTSATAVATLTTDDLVDVLAETTGTDDRKWYKITTASGVTGYVRSDFVTKATVTVDVTATDAKEVYIAGNSANIRQDASTDSARVANAQGGSKVTIIGEATGSDGNKWYQVEFDANGTKMTGFIRSDLVTTEAPVQDPEVTVIDGGTGEGDEPAETGSEDASEVTSEVPSEPDNTQIPVASDANVLTIMEPVSVVEILPTGFEQTELLLNEEVFTVWGRDNFYIMYASVNGGAPQYYLYDTENKSYVSYTGLLTEEDMAVPEDEEGLNYQLIAIICIIVIVILVIVIGILGFKLANAGYRDDDDDEDNDDEYDDDDDDEYDDDFIDLSDDNEMEADDTADYATAQIVPEEPVYEASVEDGVTYEDMHQAEPVTEAVVYEAGEVTDAYRAMNAEADLSDESFHYEMQTEEPAMYEQAVYTVPADAVSLEEEAIATGYETESFVSDEEELPVDEVTDEESFAEDEYENHRKSRKTKKAKKEKKKLSKRFLDYFTVEVEDDEDDDDIYEEADDNDDMIDVQPKAKSESSKYVDDDDDDLNFIDL